MFNAKFIALSYHFECPNCGHTVSCSVLNGSTRCNGCNRSIRVQNGKPVGWY